jgi:pimeloyl-ACP methyl ester carboxylesterase
MRLVICSGAALLLVAGGVMAYGPLPAVGARMLLYPVRHHVTRPVPDTCEQTTFDGADVRLAGWRCRTAATRRGTLIYLHGVADNRAGAAGIIERFGPRGFDVIAYDSRAHGESGGEACTYGFFEKEDLHRVVDQMPPGAIVLLGTSMGAAVALQEAAEDRRVTMVVAVETFSDLRTVATERAPFYFTKGTIRDAFLIAEKQGRFQLDAVSPVAAAARIAVPVLVIHGAADLETPPDHSRRVFDALKGPKRLIIVPDAGHNGSLRPEIWRKVESWVDDLSSPADLAKN